MSGTPRDDRTATPSRLTACVLAALLLTGCAGAPPVEEPPPEPAAEETAPPPLVSDAETAARNGDYVTAGRILEEILAEDPGDLDALKLLAKVQAASGDAASSSRTWEKVARLDPYDPDAAYESGTILAEKSAWERARSLMVALDAAGRADERHYLLAGEAALELGYRQEAERYLLKAGGTGRAETLLGMLYYEQGRMKLAEKAFTGTLERDPDDYQANLHLGYIDFSRGRISSAIEHYRKAHLAEPGDPLACLSLAAALEKRGDAAAASRYFREGLTLEGIDPAERKKVYVSLSRILLEEGDYGAVERVTSKGLSEFPSSGGIRFYRGEALLRQGRKADAREEFRKAAADPRWKRAALSRFHSID